MEALATTDVDNCARALRKACCGVGRCQSRQEDARTSRVGIERLHALVQRRQELLVALVAHKPASREVFVRLALPPLPLLRPEPSLRRIDPPVDHLTERNRSPIDRLAGRQSTAR
jgi:hypothetical protein